MSGFRFSLKNDRRGKLPTPLMLMMRIVVGGYLLYLAYTLFRDRSSGSISETVLITIVIVFVVFGGLFAGWAVKDLLSGKYEGGALDTSDSDNNISPSEHLEETDSQKPVDE